jgi:hypothetical protein
MPELGCFLGIIITMYYNDHPPPHFHARYNQQKAIIDIETLSILEGKLAHAKLATCQTSNTIRTYCPFGINNAQRY